MEMKYKIVVYTPGSHSEQIREAMGNAGAGVIGNYTFCTFTSKGVGRFLPGAGANPTIGAVGNMEAVDEERIETVCSGDTLSAVMQAIKDVHPYEEPGVDIYPIEIL